ncbi:MAG TPA: hypothetical protein PKC72_16215 [Chitinophagaceae bacterium]|nr:hypothetical protein [Chitinophagaceae bacterium]
MTKNKRNKANGYGDEAPRWKDFIIVLGVFLVLMALSWLAYYKLHWFN